MESNVVTAPEPEFVTLSTDQLVALEALHDHGTNRDLWESRIRDRRMTLCADGTYGGCSVALAANALWCLGSDDARRVAAAYYRDCLARQFVYSVFTYDQHWIGAALNRSDRYRL